MDSTGKPPLSVGNSNGPGRLKLPLGMLEGPISSLAKVPVMEPGSGDFIDGACTRESSKL